MYQTTEADDPKSQGPRGPAVRRALVMVFPTSIALDLPRHLEPVGRAWLDQCGYSDSKVSKDHVKFHTQGNSVSVEDLGSRNGTFVDGFRLDPGDACALSNRAVLRIGHTVFVYRDDLSGPAAPDQPLGGLIGPFGLRAVRAEVERIVPLVGRSPARILILGETGTGKELLAREMAMRLRGPGAEFVNVTSIPPNLFDSAVHGHARGAFSGADAEAPGLLKRNAGGAVVLDEVGDLPPEVQPKLLRFLESGEIQPLGKRPENVDVLVIAATNRFDAVSQGGQFRSDLLARFTHRLVLPPLRERPEDVFAIADALAASRRAKCYQRESVEAKAVEQLLLRPWDNFNTRELLQCVEFAATRNAPPVLRERDVIEALKALESPRHPRPTTSVTRARARDAVAAAGGNESEAAKRLGIDRGRLLRKLKE